MIADWKKNYNKKYYQENGESIKKLPSKSSLYRSIYGRIITLEKKINNSSAEKKAFLQEKKRVLVLSFQKLKENLEKERTSLKKSN